MTTLTKADVEEVALEWLSDLGWQVAHRRGIVPEAPNAERDVLSARLVSGEVRE